MCNGYFLVMILCLLNKISKFLKQNKLSYMSGEDSNNHIHNQFIIFNFNQKIINTLKKSFEFLIIDVNIFVYGIPYEYCLSVRSIHR